MKNKFYAGAGAFLAIALGTLALAPSLAGAASISSYMKIGSTGSDVTALQTYLATDSSIYPQGIISGYYGSLTAAAVARFQSAHGISAIGSVGPQTLAALNLAMGGTSAGSDITAPFMSSFSISPSRTYATASWSTSESTTGKIFYDLQPLATTEATGVYQQPYISGSVALDGNYASGHSIVLQNLQPNTTYYYRAMSVDVAGNVTVTDQLSFKTTN